MKLTIHGSERIFDRTKMVVRDVLSIISSNAVVELGSHGGCKYLLFYSPPDNRTKIAVVTDGRTHLVSIWESDYFLPTGLKSVNKENKRKAMHLCREFMFKRFAAAQQAERPKIHLAANTKQP